LRVAGRGALCLNFFTTTLLLTYDRPYRVFVFGEPFLAERQGRIDSLFKTVGDSREFFCVSGNPL